MNQDEVYSYLRTLLAMPTETEWVEFKEAKTTFDFSKLGKYFSALSNEANLHSKSSGWLVFGIEDKKRGVTGTAYRQSQGELEHLKYEIACKINNRITFSNIYEINTPQGRVILFEIPAALKGIPTSFVGHFYCREGESIGALNLNEIEKIRRQDVATDWSAQICRNASKEDLHSDAITQAKRLFAEKNPHFRGLIDQWDIITFLNKAKLTIQGQLTNTAIILLGKPESTHFLSPSGAQLTWTLYDRNGTPLDYEHFGPPFILHTDRVLAKIRNLNYRYLPEGTLFPAETTQYDPYVIREALHNCIAHQDYAFGGRITVSEKPDELLFVNPGDFIPGSIDTVIVSDAPPFFYRNQFLTNAMVHLKMIDTIGSGIRKMFTVQRERFFPMPDYDLSDPQKVAVRIYGKILNPNYSLQIRKYKDIAIEDVILLDRVQKQLSLTKTQHHQLKTKHLVEGRYPNIYISAPVASISGEKAQYIKYRGFDDKYYLDMIVKFIRTHGSASRRDIDILLDNKLSEILSETQKKVKVGNLLTKLKNQGIIVNNATKNKPKWTLKV